MCEGTQNFTMLQNREISKYTQKLKHGKANPILKFTKGVHKNMIV